MTLAATVLACERGGGPTAVSPVEYTAEELYLGLVLMDGPVADAIPEIRENVHARKFIYTEESRQLWSAIQTKLIQTISAHDPVFLQHFRSEVTSGDHLRVQEALIEASRATLRAVEAMRPDFTRDQMRQHIRHAVAEKRGGALPMGMSGGPDDPDGTGKPSDQTPPDEDAIEAALDQLFDPGQNPTPNATFVAVLVIYFGGVVVDVLLVSNYGVFIAIEVEFAVDNDLQVLATNGGVSLLRERIIDSVSQRLATGSASM